MSAIQNTLTVIGDSTVSYSFTPADVRWLQQFERTTGMSMEESLSRSVALFRELEAPVYRAEYRKARRRRQRA